MVLGALVGAMTLVSGTLLLLEPGPVAPLSVLKLSSLDRAVSPERVLFDTQPNCEAREPRWSAIIVRPSGAARGSAGVLHQQHEALGLGGLAYHFVIGNGQGTADGQIEIGYRWRSQVDGAAAMGDFAAWFNRHSITICLVGDLNRSAPTTAQMRELVWLVQRLQSRLGIPPQNVRVEAGAEVNGSLPRMFNEAVFRRQLLAPVAP